MNGAQGVEPELAARVATVAFNAAYAFFLPSPEWQIDLQADNLEGTPAEARCVTRPDYMLATIVYDPTKHDDGAHLWRNIAHEVAHLLLSEYDVLQEALPRTFDRLLTHANERAVCRLHRMFLRHHPYPGDKHFERG